MAKLEVQIGADSSELKSELAAAESKIERLSKLKVERVKLGLDTKTLDDEINRAKSSLNSLKQANTDLGKSFDKTSPKIASGSNTLMQFSRIAQDAPFGIIGIGNNLTATAESFGYLSKQAGGAGNALKAIGSSILGTGGILLGVSLLTTGLTYLAQNGLTVSDVFNKMTGNFNQFANDFKKASDEAVKSTSAEIANLKALVSVSQNEKLSREERLIAVKKLQSEYPAYFGNLSKEEILTSNLIPVVNNLTKALVNRALADKLAESSADTQLKIFQANAKLVKQKQESISIEKKYNDLIADAIKKGVYNGRIKGELEAKAQNAIEASKQKEQEYRDEIIKGTKALEQRQSVINSLVSSSIKTDAPAEKTKAPAEKTKALNQPKYKNPNPNFNPGNVFLGGGIVNPNSGLTTPDLGVDEAAILAAEKLRSGLEELRLLVESFNTEMNSIINSSITDTFNNLGNSIGEALANGTSVFGAIGNTLLQSMGKFLSDMGGLLIKYGTLAVLKGKLDLAIFKGGPVSIGAGLAAIAVGVALKAAGAAIGSKSIGGGSSGGGSRISTGADYSSPSYSGGSSSVASGGTVVFEIDGQKLVGVLSNTLNKNTRLGGKLSIG